MTRLTGRESEVLGLIAEGMGIREIAPLLGIAPDTVRKHRDNAVQRVGKGSQVAAVRELDRDRSTASA